MTDPAANAARSAAAILAADLGPNLPAEVEAALAARDIQQRPDRYVDWVLLAGLIGHRHLGLDHLQRPAQPHPRPAAGLDRPPGPDRRARPGHGPAPGTERITEVVATEITRQASPPE